MPRSADGLVTSAPSTTTRPRLARTKPATMLSKVDLPQPDGPSRHVKLSSTISRLMRSSTRLDSSNAFETDSMRISDRAISRSPRVHAPPQDARFETPQHAVEGKPAQADHRRAQHQRR